MRALNRISRLLLDNRLDKIYQRNYVIKKPINREKENELPIFQYPNASSKTKRVYSWGNATTGALGLQVPKSSENYEKRCKLKFTTNPTRVSFAEFHQVIDVTCGYGFSVFSVKTNNRERLFGTGLNTDSQIGYHDPHRGHPLEVLLIPAPVSVPLKDLATKVTELSAGRAHLLVLTDKEGVFALGNNSYGQCGRKIIKDEDYFKSAYVHNIRRLNGENIKSIQCGQDHSMFITDSGKVFACGWGSDGQLGNNRLFETSSISRVIGDIEDENIVKLACSVDCVLALNDKGQVFGWGNSEYGQLNAVNETVQQIGTSRYLSQLKELGKIVDIAAAGSYCMVLNSEGDIFTWGFGILGLGPKVQQSRVPLCLPRTLFYNPFLEPSKIIKITAGFGHSAAVTDSGELFAWGKNRHGCLGLAHENDQFFPLRVAAGAKVTKVACGVDHTLALCKPFV